MITRAAFKATRKFTKSERKNSSTRHTAVLSDALDQLHIPTAELRLDDEDKNIKSDDLL